ncbi:MAG TPA: hypothetical protein VKY74_10730, partial [Chloroflexia bacterium]|nr:hypothetical protein [Chloroflexia bacterium]
MKRRTGSYVLALLVVLAWALAVGRGAGAAGPFASAGAFREDPLPANTPTATPGLTDTPGGPTPLPTDTATAVPTNTATVVPTDTVTVVPPDTATATTAPCALAWSIVSSPNPSTAGSNVLNGVAAVGANDVWAVGYYVNGSSIAQTLTEHWNGSAWTSVASPNVGIDLNVLNSVAAVTANDGWAVGSYYNTSTALHQTLVEHWNGSAWAVVASPNAGTSYNDLYGVAVVGANDVWAVGSYCLSYCSTSVPIIQPLAEHWNGS